ncbi:sensor histidine kinase [Qingrenia yutianensis]|uniref:histidine kinase n=1 Tax=Qingrenia yutianensis TaxID=2763676 RepID=A0A926FBS9_9FIRM|nr:HAMP domain-containing sensor histidine kinase [Qingrenia yutianensis]MBC8595435.1 HAMP domain-containing histidine kinase [Qingrenia yutianensis]
MKWQRHKSTKRKSISKRLLVAGCFTVIISYVIAAVFLFSMLFSSTKESNLKAIEVKKKLLLSNANRISEYSLDVFTAQSFSPNLKSYQRTLEIISQSTDTSIIVFDKTGRIVTVAGLDYDSYIGNYLKGDYIDAILKNGETVSNDDAIDAFKEQENMLIVGLPVSNTDIYGGVLISTTADVSGGKLLFEFFKQFSCSVGISLVLTFVIFYIISHKITDPIKLIDNTVTEFSKGKFDLRVECGTNDELSSLCENINNMATSIENLEKMRSSFVSNVSHELRTPMTSITGFVEGILDGTIPKEKEDEYLKIVLAEAKRLSRLVSDLLSISRLESGSFKIEKKNFDICELLRREIIKFETQIVKKNLNVELEIEQDEMFVFADSDAIIQVVTNILGNAIKFTPQDGKITIKAYYDADRVKVEIANTGEGIKKEKLKYIWDRFYKADDSRNQNPEGTGLGLYIVKSIINKSDEKIYAESVENEYTKFTFTLKKA